MDTVVIFYNVDIYLKNIWESTSEINFMLDPFQLRADFSVSIRVLEYRRCCWSWWGLNGHSHNILQCWYLFEEHFGKLLQELTLWCITSIWVSISCGGFSLYQSFRISSVLSVLTTKNIEGPTIEHVVAAPMLEWNFHCILKRFLIENVSDQLKFKDRGISKTISKFWKHCWDTMKGVHENTGPINFQSDGHIYSLGWPNDLQEKIRRTVALCNIYTTGNVSSCSQTCPCGHLC